MLLPRTGDSRQINIHETIQYIIPLAAIKQYNFHIINNFITTIFICTFNDCCLSMPVYSISTVPPTASKAFFNFSASSLGMSPSTFCGNDSTNFLAYKIKITNLGAKGKASTHNTNNNTLQTPSQDQLEETHNDNGQ